jgi:hypothetical protein
MIDIWEVRQIEAEVALEDLLKNEFSDVKDNVLTFVLPMQPKSCVARVRFPFLGIKNFAAIFIQTYNWDKNFKNLKMLKEAIRHEFLHLRYKDFDDDQLGFILAARSEKILLAKNWRKKYGIDNRAF